MNFRILILSLVIGFQFMVGGCSQIPMKPDSINLGDYSYLKKRIAWLIQKEMQKNNITGLSIAVVDDQKIIWEQGFGYSDKAKKIPTSPQTIYKVGSISKVITALGFLHLKEQQKINLDDSVKTFIPDFQLHNKNDPGITIRSLMTHHSGLPAGDSILLNQNRNKKLESLLDDLRKITISFPVGTMFSYSNLGVDLLGLLMQRLSGQEFNSYMHEQLFGPLNMSDTSYLKSQVDNPRVAKGYTEGTFQKEVFWQRIVPSGSVYSTVHDLSQFIKLIHGQGKYDKTTIISKAGFHEMISPQNLNVPLDFDYKIGLNWFLSWSKLDYAGKLVWHAGSTNYFSSLLASLPDHQLGVVVLSNTRDVFHVHHLIVEETLKLALEIKKNLKPVISKRERTKPITLSEKELNEYAGDYAITNLGHLKIEKSKNKLKCRMRNKPLELVPYPNGLFSLQYNLFGIFPIAIKEFQIGVSRINGETYVYYLNDQDMNKQLAGKKFIAKAIPDIWKKRLGKYKCLKTYYPYQSILEIKNNVLLWDQQPIVIDAGKAFFQGVQRNYGGQPLIVKKENGQEIILVGGLEFTKIDD